MIHEYKTRTVTCDAQGGFSLVLMREGAGTWVRNDDSKEFVLGETIYTDARGHSIVCYRLQRGASYFTRETWNGVRSDCWYFLRERRE